MSANLCGYVRRCEKTDYEQTEEYDERLIFHGWEYIRVLRKR